MFTGVSEMHMTSEISVVKEHLLTFWKKGEGSRPPGPPPPPQPHTHHHPPRPPSLSSCSLVLIYRDAVMYDGTA